MTQKEVAQKANEVHDISLKYHLSNVAFACNIVNRDVYKEINMQKQSDLQKELIDAEQASNDKKLGELFERKKELNSMRNHVVVDYVNMQENAGRAMMIEGYIVISLPISLADALYETNGNFNVVSAKKMREIMAHELGHIVLHGEKLFETKGTQGTIVLSKDPQLEQEAIWFAEAILKLRWDRIQKLHRLGS